MKALRIFFLTLLLIPLHAMSEVVVVTSADSPISSLTESEVRQLFSGQLRSVSGQRVQPLDLSARDSTRELFYQKLMGRSPDQMRAYWTRLIFTGQGRPPREVTGFQELLTLSSSSTEFVGYLPADQVTGQLRVLHRLR